MYETLLCSHNPILIKSLYGILIDEGCRVEVVDHPALAVQKVLDRPFSAVVMDTESVGLSAEEAVQIIGSIAPDTTVLLVGECHGPVQTAGISVPVDLAAFKQAIHSIQSAGALSHFI